MEILHVFSTKSNSSKKYKGEDNTILNPISSTKPSLELAPPKSKSVRIQLGKGSAAEVTKNMLKNDGVSAFYKDVSSLADHNFAHFPPSENQINNMSLIHLLQQQLIKAHGFERLPLNNSTLESQPNQAGDGCRDVP